MAQLVQYVTLPLQDVATEKRLVQLLGGDHLLGLVGMNRIVTGHVIHVTSRATGLVTGSLA